MSESTEPPDTNAEIWKSAEAVSAWSVQARRSDELRRAERRFLAQLLPYDPVEAFTFVDLGAGGGAAAKEVLAVYPASTAVLADFSSHMMAEAAVNLRDYQGRYSYVEFDLVEGDWATSLPSPADAVISSMCIHHLTDERKQSLFGEICHHLAPGGWYLNFDPVTATDPLVEQTWQRVNDKLDPELAAARRHPTHDDQRRWANHLRYVIPLDPQLAYLRDAGFEAVDVYSKQLDRVIYGGRRPR